MKIVGVIPARFGSTRFPGKPLVNLVNKPLIQWTVEGALKSKSLSEVIVATDHEGIREVVEKLGVRVVMTDSELPSGSDRIHAAIKQIDCDVVVNIQGDEPMVTAQLIDGLAGVFTAEPELEMATLAHPITLEEFQSMNAVKVILNNKNEAIYFSRYQIPYSRMAPIVEDGYVKGCMRHIGMYAYRKDFLKKFCESPVAVIEQGESLEQLRALALGAKIKVVSVTEASIGVDTPEDLVKLEKILKAK